MKKLTIYLSLLLIIASACKKYEEGPAISLRSKEKRLCQTWNLEEKTKNGEAIDISDPKYKWEFHKDGNFTLYSMEQNNGTWETDESLWKWADNQETIAIEAINAHNYWIFYKIKKLKYKELILELTLEDGEVFEYTLKPE
jgi:hypothetical protein